MPYYTLKKQSEELFFFQTIIQIRLEYYKNDD